MSSVRYLRKSGNLVIDFDKRKEADWKQNWVPSWETIHEGQVITEIKRVVTAPSTVFFNGTIATSSVTLEVEYDNESIAQVHPTTVTCDTSVLGPATATASVGGLSITFSVTVVAPALTSITAAGAKSTFSVGEAFVTTGLVVTAHYENETTDDVTSAAVVDSSGVNMASAGTYTVNISYMEKTTSYQITVS